jgi:transcription elongation factor Elf1
MPWYYSVTLTCDDCNRTKRDWLVCLNKEREKIVIGCSICKSAERTWLPKLIGSRSWYYVHPLKISIYKKY